MRPKSEWIPMELFYEPDDARLLAWEQWLLERPAAIQEIAKLYPPWNCYYTIRHPHAHYAVVGYHESAEGVRVELIHGRDSFLPGAKTLVEPTQLVPCSCKRWKGPTELQDKYTR